MASVTKTVKLELYRRPETDRFFLTTKELFNQVVSFYFGVIQAHEEILEYSNKQALTILEKLTHRTKQNPEPIIPLEQVSGYIPAMFRRAAINAALGTARSFYNRLEKWHKGKAKFEAEGKRYTHRPPVPPRKFNFNPVFYAGQYRWVQNSIMLRLYDGNNWRWVKYRYSGPAWNKEWKPESPSAVIGSNHISLRVPIVKEFDAPPSVKDQLQSSVRICAVDLNINDSLAVCVILESDGTVAAVKFIRGGRRLHDRRKRLLGKIAVKRSQTGILNPHEQDNKHLWEKIRAIDNYEAHRISRRIVDFAKEYRAGTIVFEHLKKYTPQKGKYSTKANQKRSYWLRGRIQKYTRYKAWQEGILTCLISPYNTSRLCHICGSEIVRYDKEPEGYRPGAPLYSCSCGKCGNADFNAAANIGKKLLSRYLKPSGKLEGVSVIQEAG